MQTWAKSWLKACSRSMKAQMAPSFCAWAMAESASDVFPVLSGPKICRQLTPEILCDHASCLPTTVATWFGNGTIAGHWMRTAVQILVGEAHLDDARLREATTKGKVQGQGASGVEFPGPEAKLSHGSRL